MARGVRVMARGVRVMARRVRVMAGGARSVTSRCSPHSVGFSTSSFRAPVAQSSNPELRRFCGHFLDAVTARSMTGGITLPVRHTGEAVIIEKAVKLPIRSRTTLPAEEPKIHTLTPVSAEISAKRMSDFRLIKKPNRCNPPINNRSQK